MQIGLGTASFGMAYGVANQQQMSLVEAHEILQTAHSSRFNLIDTAQLYGEAEAVLGQSELLAEFNVITKLDSIEKLSREEVRSLFEQSLQRLNSPSLYGCMLHRAKDLLGTSAKQNWAKLQALKEQGLVSKIGVSVYSPEELLSILQHHSIDLVQLPLNVLDQRFISSGALAKAREHGVEVHIRSAFLQGLLLMDVKSLPTYFSPFKAPLLALSELQKKLNVSPAALALAFFKQLDSIDALILGINSVAQLSDLTAQLKGLDAIPKIDFSQFASEEERLILPTNWQVH